VKTAYTRREFIGASTAAAAGVALGLSPRAYAQSRGANEKVVLGVIGCGEQGRQNLRAFMACDDVEIAALCDVDTQHLELAAQLVAEAERPAPRTYRDFRHVIDRPDIDAVVIATPDHWHALPFIAACETGKDIYCEKPTSHSFVEAKAMLAAARHFKRVVQVGTMQRSMRHFQQALDFVHSGRLGQITLCRAWNVHGIADDQWVHGLGRQTPTTPPPELDWDFWLGPAPAHGYAPNRAHFDWRNFFDYGGGMMTDWGVHMIDTVLLGMRESDPTTIFSHGGIFARRDDRETPDTMQTVYQFPNWLLQWETRLANGRGLDGGAKHGAEFIGTKGTLIVDRQGYHFFPEDKNNTDGPPRALVNQPNPHWQQFVDCVKSRGTPRSDIESMTKVTLLCHLGNISYRTGRVMQWDATTWDAKNRAEVTACSSYQREYRAPWKLKHYSA
jgi:predicted dehydrogenase